MFRVRAVTIAASLAIVVLLGRPGHSGPFAQSSQTPNLSSPTSPAQPETHGEPMPGGRSDAKKAKEAYQQGVRAERNEDWDAAYTAYSDAVNYAPNNREYFIHRELAKSRLVQERADDAERDAVSGKLDEARQALLSATYLDPTNRVLRERLGELIAQEPGQNRAVTEPELAGPPLLEYQKGTRNFDYRGDTQGAYEEVGKQFGVEVAFDGDLVSQRVHFEVSDVDFPTAVRLLGEMTGTFWRPLGKRLFFVVQNTLQKRKDYDVSVVRTILLPASETADEMMEITRLVREVAGIPRSELDINSRTLTLRASPQAMAVATDLIDNLERPVGELVLEIEVLEVNKDYARQMGITPPETAQTFSVSSAQIQEAEASEEGLLDVLQQVFGSTTIPGLVAFGGGLTTQLATLPGATANLSEMLSLVKTGRRILLRADDGQKATFFVGQRIPVSLSTYSASFVSGQGVSSSAITNPIVNYPAGNAPSFVATTSLRDNAINDLIVANSADNTVSVLLGNGDGTFASQVTYPTGTDPVSIATGQFNNGTTAVNSDDFPDLAVANKAANTVSILLASPGGDGTFQPKVDIPTGRAPVSVVSANFHDLNGVAGAVDLAVANQGDNTISIFQGNGDGTFRAPTLIALPVGFEPTCLAAADLNDDGHIDLVVADQGNNTFSVLLGNGDGTFQPRKDYPTGNAPVYVAFGDFNGDGALDIAVANNGAPTSTNTGNTVSIYYNQISNQNVPTGTFVAGTTRDFAAGTGPTSIAVADYNLDGLADLVVSDETDNAISVILNLGGEQFAANVELPVDTAPVSVTTADFNADGRPDIATANSGAANITVILNTASLLGSGLGTSGTPYPGVEYLDVGLKVEATPRIHPNDVTLNLALDISSLTGTSINSIPVITNETVEQTLRLRQNETAMLAGFLQSDLTNAIAGTPGIAEIPDVGLIAGNQSAQNQSSELLILVTPRLVRLAPRKDRVIYAGQGSGEGEAGAGGEGLGALGGISPREGEGIPQRQAAPPPETPIEPTPEPAQAMPGQQPPPPGTGAQINRPPPQ
jgi:Flp pilus assembly secretin CpaC